MKPVVMSGRQNKAKGLTHKPFTETMQVIMSMRGDQARQDIKAHENNVREGGLLPWKDLSKPPLIPKIKKRDKLKSKAEVRTLTQDCHEKISPPGVLPAIWNPNPNPFVEESGDEDNNTPTDPLEGR